jgi:hypothetical protein
LALRAWSSGSATGLAGNDADTAVALLNPNWTNPGALSVSRHPSASLDVPLIAGGVSRLVFDCNRLPESPSAIPERFELIEPHSGLLTSADEQAGAASEPLTLLKPALREAGLAEEGELQHA